MSSISYRNWDIWVNKTYWDSQGTFEGYYECDLIPILMTNQTVEFMVENFQMINGEISAVNIADRNFIQSQMFNKNGQLVLKMYERLETTEDIINIINSLTNRLESLSLCLDAPLICRNIIYNSNANGPIFTANRRPIGRGIGFEVEERSVAKNKIMNDYNYLLNSTDPYFKVGKKHYIAGLTLLGLEDQITGLIDAAFMQFYQGCEALCRDPKGHLENSKKYIASCQINNNRELQIIAHHVWRVRNKYFGHGDVTYNLNANSSFENAVQIAKQVLVARYLCKQLLEINVPSAEPLVREMGLFGNEYSGNFNGTINQLENQFRADYDSRKVKIYDCDGDEIETYEIN